MVFSDFDGTIREGNAALELSMVIGKGKEAKELYFNLYSKSKKIVNQAENQSQLMKELDALYKKQLENGARLLKGVPVEKTKEISYKPNCKFLKMVEIAKKEGKLEIATLNDKIFVENFIEKNKEKLPEYKIVSFSELERFNGSFTGRILKYSGIEDKYNAYKTGSVFANSIVDIGSCIKANERNYNVFILNDDHENVLLEEALKKFNVPFSYL
ncbi:MAG: hypothetical protein QXD43_02570 [Candidatus Aenigmatarchaeota archaeon]